MNRTKEEIAKGIRDVQEVRRQRSFVKDKFFPSLIKASTSIEDAKYLLTSLGNMIMQEFLAQMKEKKFNELKLTEKLDSKSPQFEDIKTMVELFNDESIFTARELVEGMQNEIETNVTDELKARKLDSLKTNWFDI